MPSLPTRATGTGSSSISVRYEQPAIAWFQVSTTSAITVCSSSPGRCEVPPSSIARKMHPDAQER
ncbi:hypothetical protein D3C83_168660 [compost metagenome]